jgi:hypothetical protein
MMRSRMLGSKPEEVKKTKGWKKKRESRGTKAPDKKHTKAKFNDKTK